MTKGLLAASLAVLFLFAYLTAIRPAYTVAYALGILFVVAWLWPKLASRRITIERTLDAGIPTVGEGFEEAFTVRKHSAIPAPWVEVTDLSRVRDYHPGRVISLARERASWSSRGIYRQRGWVTFGPTRVRVSEPFGLFKHEIRLNQKNQVLVYPRVRKLPELLMPATSTPAPRSGRATGRTTRRRPAASASTPRATPSAASTGRSPRSTSS